MNIKAYIMDGCGACQKQKEVFDDMEINVDTHRPKSGITSVPTIDVECDNGTNQRMVGVSSAEELRGVCQK